MPDRFPLNPKVQFRQHQMEAPQALMDYWRKGGGNPVIDIATGGGKSILIAEAVRQILNVAPHSRIGIITISKELVTQNEDACKLVCPRMPTGVVMAGLNRKEYKSQVIIGSVQTLYRALGKTGGFHAILVDECHLVPLFPAFDQEAGERKPDTTMFGKLLAENAKIVPNFRIAGFTATPWRESNMPIFGWERGRFSEVIYRMGIGEAIEKGYLVPPVTRVMENQINTAGLKVSSATGDFIEKQLAAVANDDKINIPAVRDTIEALETRNSAVVFCASIDHATRVRDIFRDAGTPAEVVHGQLKKAEREKIINDFRAGKFRVLVNCQVLLIGFDHKALDLITVLRPTRSSSAWLQLVGRGLRVSPTTDKLDCLVLDYTENSEHFGPIDLIEAPKPPKPKLPREDDIGNLRDCPECMALVSISSRVCPGCGYEFPVTEKGLQIADEASQAVLLSTQSLPDRKFKVTSWMSSRQQKMGKPPYLRVDHFDGYKTRCSEFILLEHGGAPRSRATRWWAEHGGLNPAPETVDEALQRWSEVKPPSAVVLRKDGKWDRVVGRTFGEVITEEDAA
ncbi:helicase-related protein [Sulfitobacter sp. 1A15106]|uniref:DEAD/DEAH box helicase n=1 Tax=Sulfitobacter sp. 1A15106 TaxID=3368590 RepID=UPI003746286F